MKNHPLAWVAWATMLVLLVLHNDFWLWQDSGRLLGLPIGLAYHVLFCLVTLASLAFLVRVAWPRPRFPESSDSHPSSRAD